MAIISFNVNVTGLVGSAVNPRRCTMVTTDNLAAVTAAGYLNNQNNLGNPILPTDIFEVLYSFNQATQIGTYGIFQLTYSVATGYTLVLWGNPGDVLLPVVSGDFAVFNGTTGQIKDAGYSATNAAKTKVVMLNAAPTINHLAIFTAADGTIGDGGVAGTAAAKAASDNTKATLASINAAPTSGHFAAFTDNVGTIGDGGVAGTAAAKAASNAALSTVASTAGSGFTAGHIVTAADAAGTIQDSGILASAVQLSANIKAALTGNIGGGGAGPIDVTVAGMTAASVVVAALASSSNAVQVQTVLPGTGKFSVTFTGDPGASAILNYVAFIAAQ